MYTVYAGWKIKLSYSTCMAENYWSVTLDHDLLGKMSAKCKVVVNCILGCQHMKSLDFSGILPKSVLDIYFYYIYAFIF